VTASATVNGTPGAIPSFDASGGSGASAIYSTGSVNSIGVSVVFGITNSRNSGVTLSLNTTTERFYSTPEPVSLSLFGIGVAGIALARRRILPVLTSARRRANSAT
jgi:hypothetical protein